MSTIINYSSPPTQRRKSTYASEQAAAMLRERIRSGLYKAQTWLPSERDLAKDLHVHRRIVREALEELVREELIYRRPNCRPIIGQPVDEDSAPRAIRSASLSLSSKFVALIMWHGGGPLERARTAQSRIFWGINHALAQEGRHAVFLDLGGEHDGPNENIGSSEQIAEREARQLQYVLDKGFGGVIFYPYAYSSNRDLIREVSRRMPLVLLDRKIAGVNADFVGVDNHQAMFDMTLHLIERGHRRIAYVTRCEPIHPVQDRLQGYLAAIYHHPELKVQEMIVTLPLRNETTSWPVVDAVFGLPQGQRPTAALCVSDYAAVLLAERLEHRVLSVPADLALAGFDDIISALPNGVGLTSMAQPFEEIGRVAAELLVQQWQQPRPAPKSVELPVRMVVRESSESVP